jgi:hypothetical protein
MKADRKFSCYSEREWEAIAAVIARLLPFVDMTGLRERLELLGRAYVSMPRLDPDELKFLVTHADQCAEFREKVEADRRLPPELQKRATDAVSELEQHYQDQISQLGQDYGPPLQRLDLGPHHHRTCYAIPREQNAQLPVLDCYFESLLDEWMHLGVHWLVQSNTKPIRTFVAVCVRPMVGPKSATERAIGERLYRLDQHRVSTKPRPDAGKAVALRDMWLRAVADVEKWRRQP